MTDAEWHDLAEAYRHGQDGGSFEIINSTDSSAVELVHLQTERPHPWLVTLNALDPVGGIIGGDVGSVDRTLIAQLQLKARVQWGGRNAVETCDVDWPVAGCTLQVNGRNVRVWGQPVGGLVLTPGSIRPKATAFVAPLAHGRTQPRAPTFTYPLTAIGLAAGNTVAFEVPKRAVAYSILGYWQDLANHRFPWEYLGTTGDAYTVVTKQNAAPNVDVAVDNIYSGGSPIPAVGIAGDHAAKIPLLPETTRVLLNVTNAAGVGVFAAQFVQAQFYLDLG